MNPEGTELPVTFISAYGRDETVARALEAGGADNIVKPYSPTELAARTDDGRIVSAQVAGGAAPDGRNPEGETPLHTAIRTGGNSEKPAVVEALIGWGADACVEDAAGYIPYHTAREGGTVRDLLARAGGSDRGCDGRAATTGLDEELVRRIQAALAAKNHALPGNARRPQTSAPINGACRATANIGAFTAEAFGRQTRRRPGTLTPGLTRPPDGCAHRSSVGQGGQAK